MTREGEQRTADQRQRMWAPSVQEHATCIIAVLRRACAAGGVCHQQQCKTRRTDAKGNCPPAVRSAVHSLAFSASTPPPPLSKKQQCFAAEPGGSSGALSSNQKVPRNQGAFVHSHEQPCTAEKKSVPFPSSQFCNQSALSQTEHQDPTQWLEQECHQIACRRQPHRQCAWERLW